MKNLTDDLKVKLSRLEEVFNNYEKVLVALSGGVDSCLAAFLGRKFLGKENSVSVISNSESLKEKDYKIALEFCKTNDIKYEVIYTEELSNPEYAANPDNRCYFCKSELFGTMNKLAEERFQNYRILNGNNYSDLGDYRPGLNAAKEQESFAPFIECKITKKDIRDLAFYFNLSVWDKPASPCLSSRFPYGEQITKEKLKRVEEAEEILNEFGFDEVRVRSYGDKAKIEVPKEKVSILKEKFENIESKIKQIGFSACEVDSEGFISGKLNRAL
ncbi:MAG: ATP-dependent sacrificial sulfur transferase LarE [Melioribacteraceae bacterium]|nr:ATP-dependent sacrificial sulfur transferase LarE [Melioribacteraceae bacterium]